MIAITGATGTVGREVVRLLVERGHRPRVISRDVAVARATFGGSVDYAEADLDRPESLPAALGGAERVFVLTPATSRQTAREAALVMAAARAGIRHVVKTSVFRANTTSPLHIARQHGHLEALIAGTAPEWTFLRPLFFMQNLTGQVLNGELRTAAEDGRVGMVDAGDVAAAAVAVLTTPFHAGRTYTLTGPRTVTFDEVAEAAWSAGAATAHRRVAPPLVRAGMLQSGAEDWFASDMARLHTMLAAGYEDVVTGDLARLTGGPGRDVTSFLQDMLMDAPGARRVRTTSTSQTVALRSH